MLVLVFLYYRFSWWPIHPIGYLAAYGFGMRILWFSFLGGVALQPPLSCITAARRCSGACGSCSSALIMGDFLMGGVWAVVGLFSGSSYQVFPF